MHLPVFMSMAKRNALVVGGSETAARKVRLLRKAEAAITIVAPVLCPELQALADNGNLTHVARAFTAADIDGAALVFAATEREDVDVAVAEAARSVGVPVNAVDRPAHSDFILPSIVDRSPVVIAISSGGTAPVLTRSLRARLEALIPADIGKLAAFADRFRGAVMKVIRQPAARRAFWERFFDGPLAAKIMAGDEQEATEGMLSAINAADAGRAPEGKVSFVGITDNDPDLFTFRAMRDMQQADLVVYDERTDEKMLEYVRRDAERLFVGHRSDKPAVHQSIINRLLADAVRRGRRVVRLVPAGMQDNSREGAEAAYLVSRHRKFDILPTVASQGGATIVDIPLSETTAPAALRQAAH